MIGSSAGTDPRAVLRVVDELFWYLRREGFEISTAQSIDAVRALQLVGLESRAHVEWTLSSLFVQLPADRARFRSAFDGYFAKEQRTDFWARLREQGFSEEELAKFRSLVTASLAMDDVALDAALLGGNEFQHLMRLFQAHASPMRRLGQLGLHEERAARRMGLTRASDGLTELRHRLSDAFGERGELLANAIERELIVARSRVRDQLRSTFERGQPVAHDAQSTPFIELSADDLALVRDSVRQLAERLRGKEAIRRKHARRGRIDVHATMRSGLRTGGVPMKLIRIEKKRDKPKLLVLCDVSDSVRQASTFMLEFVAVTHELFREARSYVFVSDVAETTSTFRTDPPRIALAKAFTAVPSQHNSNYGRALARFFEIAKLHLDRRTTLVILGDGRSNYQPAGSEIIRDLRARVGSLLWLCPERKDSWGGGDSAIPEYEPYCSELLSVSTANELEDAMRLVTRLR